MIKIRLLALSLFALLASGGLMAAEHEVKMLNMGADGTMVFEPGFLKVEPGDTVKFLATDGGHNSVSSFTPEGGSTWKGAINEEVTVKMDKEGVYIYLCTPHTVMAMVGVIQVGKATNKADAEKSAKELTAKFVMNKDRLEKYMSEVK